MLPCVLLAGGSSMDSGIECLLGGDQDIRDQRSDQRSGRSGLITVIGAGTHLHEARQGCLQLLAPLHVPASCHYGVDLAAVPAP